MVYAGGYIGDSAYSIYNLIILQTMYSLLSSIVKSL